MKKIMVVFILAAIILLHILIQVFALPLEIDFYQIYEEHGTVMLLVDPETGKIEHANKAACDFYGYTLEQLKSMKIHELNATSPEETNEKMQEAIKNYEISYIIEQRLSSGDVRTVEVYACLHIFNGRTLLFSTIYDITDKVELERRKDFLYSMLLFVVTGVAVVIGLFSFVLYINLKKLKIRNHEIETLNELRKTYFDSYDNMTYLKDENLKYVFVNKAVTDLYEKDESEIIGHDDYEILDRELAEKQRETDLMVLKNNTVYHSELAWKERIFKSIKFPVRLINGQYGVGAYIEDITENKEQGERIEYLLTHDSLTGLYNRMFLEKEINRLDTKENLPISVIMADMNGLKLANDIFGHDTGDLLLQKAAETFRNVCRTGDIIARMGGDEFIILLPRTTTEEAEYIIWKIKEKFSGVKIKAIRGSISMGCDTKIFEDDDIFNIIKNAENKMYIAKTLDKSIFQSTGIKTLIDTLHRISPREAEHSKNVSRLCERIGKEMGLPEREVRRLKEAGFLHNIGKVVLEENLINKKESLTNQEKKKLMQHTIAGYRILNFFDSTLDLAEAVLSHHERWDGTGYPKGLKGKEIPLLSRIIAVAESYDVMTNKLYNNNLSKEEAIKKLEKQAGIKYDPEVVRILARIFNQPKA